MPKLEGYRFITNVDSEMHYLLKAILLRLLYLPEQPESDETKQMLQLRAYRNLCTPPENEPPWPALNKEVRAPRLFERGWHRFWEKQRPLVIERREAF